MYQIVSQYINSRHASHYSDKLRPVELYGDGGPEIFCIILSMHYI
jgi:hypothetical protein